MGEGIEHVQVGRTFIRSVWEEPWVLSIRMPTELATAFIIFSVMEHASIQLGLALDIHI